jgi:hypothetical protein
VNAFLLVVDERIQNQDRSPREILAERGGAQPRAGRNVFIYSITFVVKNPLPLWRSRHHDRQKKVQSS